MSKDKARGLMRLLVVLKDIADCEPYGGVIVGHEQGWPITPELERLEEDGLIERYRTRAVAKRSSMFRFLRSRSGGGPPRMTKVRITAAGQELLRQRYDPDEAEAILSDLLCRATWSEGRLGWCSGRGWCSLLCTIAQRKEQRIRHPMP